MQAVVLVLAILLFLWTASLYVPVQAPFGFAVLFARSTAGALSPHLCVAGVGGAVLAWWLGLPVAALFYVVNAGLALYAARRITSTHGDFGGAFGPAWEDRIAPAQRLRMLSRRWSWRLSESPQPRWTRDVPFWTIPSTDRTLLCDLWQPPQEVEPSGVAYIYFHGSAWYILDKDAYTRRFFRHLAAQGHVVMDVAYRLYPETDVPGMIGDVKRAVAWMKANGANYGVDPNRIVIGGSSAGGHLAQLAGYAPHHRALTPEDVQGLDLSVRGIVSCYGPSDLTACFQHTNQHKLPGVGETPPDLKLLTAQMPAPMVKILGKDAARMGYHKTAVAGRLDWLMGGTPQQVPERYALYSPINHVHAGCPPTLLIQGADDLITSAQATRELFGKLKAAGVPAINVIYPYTDHMFDLMLWANSPSAQGATYAIERFLAVVAGGATQGERAAG